MSLFLNTLLSQTAPAGQAATAAQTQGASRIQNLVGNPMVMVALLLLVFYFIIIRPQSKQQKQLKLFLQNLKKGDEVVSTSGIIGRVVLVEERAVTLDTGSGNKIRIIKGQIAGAWTEKPAMGEAAKAEAKK